MERLQNLLPLLPAVLIAIVLHEFAHGYASYRLGDPTPKADGRLSLNPLKHLDLLGTLSLLFFGFGWAKPVQVDPRYYRHKKAGVAIVGLAGPLMNFLLAFLSFLGMGIIIKSTGGYVSQNVYAVFAFFAQLASINLGLGMFNLIPIPPLDGSKVFGILLPQKLYFKWVQLGRYGTLLLLAALALGLNKPLGVAVDAISTGMIWVVGLLLGM